MIIKLKAKVLEMSEEQMEANEKYDMGDIARSKDWVWRNIGVPVDEVYRITEYTRTKTIVEMNGGERIMVAEAFDIVFEKWQKLRKEMAGYGIEEEEKEAPEEKTDEGEDE